MSDLSPLAASPLFGLGGVSPLRSLLSPLGVNNSLNVGFSSGLSVFGGSSTVVELSGIGQVLSAAAIFQGSLAVLRPGSTSSGIGENFGGDFASLAAEAQNFVDGFNTLQRSLGSLAGNFGGIAGQQLAGSFVEALNRQLAVDLAAGGAGVSAPGNLAGLGIGLRTPALSGFPGLGGGELEIDLAALRTAFEADPEASFAALAQSVRGFEGLASTFTTSTGALSLTVGNLVQSAAAGSVLGLFANPGLGSAGGVSDLLLLSAFSNSRSGQLQQLAALSQFALVSSLLG